MARKRRGSGAAKPMARRREDLAARIEAVYRHATGAAHRRGANKWIAGLARMHPLSVSRVLAGRQSADRLEAILDAIEVGRQRFTDRMDDSLRIVSKKRKGA